MKILKNLWENRVAIVKMKLGYGGIVFITSGVLTLPIDFSYRLVILGLIFIMLQRTITE
jgi:hypothetical protein